MLWFGRSVAEHLNYLQQKKVFAVVVFLLRIIKFCCNQNFIFELLSIDLLWLATDFLGRCAAPQKFSVNIDNFDIDYYWYFYLLIQWSCFISFLVWFVSGVLVNKNAILCTICNEYYINHLNSWCCYLCLLLLLLEMCERLEILLFSVDFHCTLCIKSSFWTLKCKLRGWLSVFLVLKHKLYQLLMSPRLNCSDVNFADNFVLFCFVIVIHDTIFYIIIFAGFFICCDGYYKHTGIH